MRYITQGGVSIYKSLFFKVDVLDEISIKNKKYFDIAQFLILLATFSCFIHHWAARTVIAASAILFCILPGIRNVAFIHKGSKIIIPFALLGVGVAYYYGNTYGLLLYLMFAAIMYFCFVVRAIATKRFFEKILDVMCLGGCFATLVAIAGELNNFAYGTARAKAGFPNPNFFGAALMIVILVCIYKVVSEAPNTYIYCITAALNALGIILCGSMSLWVVMAIAALVLFLLNKNNNMLIALLSVVGFLVLAIIFKPELFARLDEIGVTIANRVKIWEFAIEHIKTAPIFGRGFFSYKYLYNLLLPVRPNIYKASLSHSIILDSLLCHGIVGTLLLLYYVARYIIDLIVCRKRLKAIKERRTLNSFIIAVCICIALYGLIDTTFIWVQSGSLLILITSGIGVDENKLRTIEKPKR